MKIYSIISSLFLAAAAVGAAEADTSLDQVPVGGEVYDTEEYDMARGTRDFMVLDKDKAEITIVQGGKILLRTPALIGKNKTDEIAENSTPAGVWPTKLYASKTTDNGTAIAFLCDENMACWTIHSVLRNKLGRLKSLSTPSPEDNYMTNGCPNVPTKVYPMLEKFVIEATNRNGQSPLFIVKPSKGSQIQVSFDAPNP